MLFSAWGMSLEQIRHHWRNWWECVGYDCAILEQKLPFLKENENKIFHFIEPYFKFYPAMEKRYYMSILSKRSIEAAKIIHSKSVENSCSIAM